MIPFKDFEIELTRLRWNRHQKRDYLLDNYQKEAIHELDEQQRTEFYEYLRSQPSPPHVPINNAMSREELIMKIESEMVRLDWTPGKKYECLVERYNLRSLQTMNHAALEDLLNYLQSQPTPQLQVKIPSDLFDEIEQYLQAQAANADAEASRLLMTLEDLEIDRTSKEYGLTGQE